MPGFLYQSYCHETRDDVAEQIISVMVYPDGWAPNGSYNLPGSANRIRLNPTQVDERSFYPPSCEAPGYLPYLPGTVADFVPLWAAALSVIAVAYAVRMAKVALGQGRS